MASGEIIKRDKPEDTLIVFDEIQECSHALNTLKYFCENTPYYHVACAGSLLGIALSKPASFPVGKVDFLEIMPMTFTEFKGALSENYVLQALQNQFEAIPIGRWTILGMKLTYILPVEVKSESNVASRRLQKFKEKFGDKVKLRIRFSLHNLCLDDDLLNIPLFMADYTNKLIGMALKQLEKKI